MPLPPIRLVVSNPAPQCETELENGGENTRHNRRVTVGFCLLLTILALIPRLLALRHSLWYDELWTTDFMRYGPVYALTHQQGYNNHLLNSLLGSLTLKARLLLTGVKPLDSTPAELLRMPALLFGTLSVPMLFIAVKERIGLTAAVVSALLLALSPVAVDISAQTRAYSSIVFFTIAQAHWFGRALDRGLARDWSLWLLCSVVGVFAHLYMVFVIVVDGLFLLAIVAGPLRRRDHPRAISLLKQGMVVFAAWSVLGAICYAGVIAALRSELSRQAGTQPMARAHQVIAPMLQMWGGVPEGTHKTLFYALAGGLCVCGIWYLARERRATGLYLILLLIVPPLLVEAAHPHYVYPRFFSFALPAFLTIIACGSWQIGLWAAHFAGERSKVWLRGSAIGGLTALFCAVTLSGLRAVVTLPKQDYANAAERMKVEQRKGEALIGIGMGCEYFTIYGLHPDYPRSEAELARIVRAHGSALIADTDLVVNNSEPTPLRSQFVRRYAGAPIAVFPGRNADWKHRWLDGNSDIKIYRLRAEQLPPPKSKFSGAITPGTSPHPRPLSLPFVPH